MKDVAAELVMPRGGTVDLVLTLIALPVTALTLRARAKSHPLY